MSITYPNLAPCRDDSEHFRDRSLYEAYGLPEAWTKRMLQSKGTWFAPDEYFWTPDGFFMALPEMTPDLLREIRSCTGGSFYAFSLEDQCKLTNTPIVKISKKTLLQENSVHDESVRFEHLCLSYFSHEGWHGDCTEGGVVAIFNWSVLRKCRAKNIVSHRSSKPRSPSKLVCRDCVSDSEEKFIRSTIDSLYSNLDETYAAFLLHPKSFLLPSRANPNTISRDRFISTIRAFGVDMLYRIIERILLGYGGAGHPDLTLHRDGRLRFVEAKSRYDKFTHRQAYFIRNLALPLGLDFSVLHVT